MRSMSLLSSGTTSNLVQLLLIVYYLVHVCEDSRSEGRGTRRRTNLLSLEGSRRGAAGVLWQGGAYPTLPLLSATEAA